jgi:hypothetical protein
MTKHQKMKAIDFIKENGIDKARDVVEGAPAICTYFEEYPLGVRYYRSDIGFNMAIKISDLKRLIESFDLVNSLGGVQEATNKAFEMTMLVVGFNPDKIEQAIADYESIGGEHV